MAKVHRNYSIRRHKDFESKTPIIVATKTTSSGYQEELRQLWLTKLLQKISAVLMA
jgi:hypothetical protein